MTKGPQMFIQIVILVLSEDAVQLIIDLAPCSPPLGLNCVRKPK